METTRLNVNVDAIVGVIEDTLLEEGSVSGVWRMLNAPKMRYRILGKFQDGDKTDPAIIAATKEGIKDYYLDTSEYNEDGTLTADSQAEIDALEQVIFPWMDEFLPDKPRAAQWLYETRRSRYCVTFMKLVSENNIARAILAAHFIGTTAAGKFEVIPLNDAASQCAYGESTFKQVRKRSEAVQETLEVLNLKNVLVLGGGCCPELVVRYFDLKKCGAKITIVDREDHTAEIEQLLGCTLEEANITSIQMEILDFLKSEEYNDRFRYCYMMGVGSYFTKEQLPEIVEGVYKMLEYEGWFDFDLQTYVPDGTFEFAVGGVYWPTNMRAGNPEEERKLAYEVAEAAGFEVSDEYDEEYTMPAGVFISCYKGDNDDGSDDEGEGGED